MSSARRLRRTQSFLMYFRKRRDFIWIGQIIGLFTGFDLGLKSALIHSVSLTHGITHSAINARSTSLRMSGLFGPLMKSLFMQ